MPSAIIDDRNLPKHAKDPFTKLECMGAFGYHNQDFHQDPKANKQKIELARYIAGKVGRPTLKDETNPIKEDFKIVRWHWSSQGIKPRYRRRAAYNPRPSSRRANPGNDFEPP